MSSTAGSPMKDVKESMPVTVEASKSSTSIINNTQTKPKQQSKKSEKIKVHLVAVGSAPILKKSKFLMNANDQFGVANTFLRKILKMQQSTTTTTPSAASAPPSSSSLFLYINAAFVPSPDERIGDLYDCFGIRGELVIHYSLQEAWG